jgi:maltose/maltodextrin transport system substrate-binding protein
MAEVGEKLEKEVGMKVVVQHPESQTDKAQAAAQNDTGPDIIFRTGDRLGEWVDAGLLGPVNVTDDYNFKFIPMSWNMVTHQQDIYGYPLALEVLSLIYNEKYVTSAPPAQLADLPAFAQHLKSKYPDVIAIMWDCRVPYFSWPLLASAGAYPFNNDPSGCDIDGIEVDSPGAVKALALITDMINEGVLLRGASYPVMEQEMNSGELRP